MRQDSFGLFWQDMASKKAATKKQSSLPRVRPPIPETGWKRPKDFPNLASAKMISIDVETNDPGLMQHGPGFVRGESFVAGLAVGTEDGAAWYFPIRHDSSEHNFEVDKVLEWARDQLSRQGQPKVGAHIIYDLEALRYENVIVKGPFYDVQYAEPLLNEHAYSYSLDNIAKRHLGHGKDDQQLYDWCAAAFGGDNTRGAQAGNMWRAPVELVGPYAEGDVTLPFEILKKQKPALEAEGLWDLFDLECRLIPMLLAMRLRGVRVDVERAEEMSQMLQDRVDRDKALLNKIAGFEVNISAAADLARVFDGLGVQYPRTEKGNPSFRTEWLKYQARNEDAAGLIIDARKWQKFKGTFIDGYILDNQIDGRIYGQFHPLKTDRNGTVSGRFSSSQPNLENIPARDPELGPKVRSLFLPDLGEEWMSHDYSQIEYRFLVHFATGPAAELARAAYHKDPTTDYHGMVQRWLDNELDRKATKNVNFGLIYGMGKSTLAAMCGWTEMQADYFFEMYHDRIPYAKALMDATCRIAESRGYIKTILGRRCRFNLYEPARYSKKDKWIPVTREAAKAKWPNERLKRAFGYAACNRLLQGSAADLMKKALVEIWEAGICDVLGAPLNLVHDEIDWSLPKTKQGRSAMNQVKEIMETCLPISVPIMVDIETGENWGNTHEVRN